MGKSTPILKRELEEGKYQKLLHDIYLDPDVLTYQTRRYVHALNSFEQLFGEREAQIYSAPGRSEVGGNHTDHQCGKVLAASVNLDAIAVVSKTDDGMIRVKSEGYDQVQVEVSSLEPVKEEEGTSRALIKGVAARLKEGGYRIGGFEAYVTSDVLSGSGMSSSAAYEVLMGTIFSGLYNDMKIDPVFLAQAGQYAENVYFGKPCGLMDQMACSEGGLVYIDFADPENPLVRRVDTDFAAYHHSLCITNTGGSHADLTGDYAAVPAEMKKVAACFGKETLREVAEEDFYRKLPELRQEVGDRCILRAMHLFGENQRVDRQVEMLERREFEAFKKLIRESGDSSFKYLQNVYSAHKPQEQGIAVGLAVSEAVLGEKGAVRVHGGGFAGTIQAFVPDELVDTYKEALEKVFGKDSCYVLKVRNYGGMRVI